MKEKIVKIVCFVAYYIGLIHLCYYLNRKKSLILVYHNVIPDEYWDDSIHLSVSIKQSLFEHHLAIINKRLKVSTRLHEEGTVMITFDDGYSNAMIAAECLDKYDNKSVFFIPINNIDSIAPLWIDKIWLWFSYVPTRTYCICGDDFLIEETSLSRALAFSKIIDILFDNYDKKALIIDELDRILPFEKVAAQMNERYFHLRFQGLSQKEIKKLQHRGFKIGGHSIDHDILSMLSLCDLKHDFETVSQQVNNLYNIDLYAYPYGHSKQVSQDVIQACQESNFTHAVMNEEYVVNATEYTLPRISINNLSNRYQIEARLSGFIKMCHSLFNIL